MIKEKYKGKTVQIDTQIPYYFTLPGTNLIVENIDGARAMAIGMSYLISFGRKYTLILGTPNVMQNNLQNFLQPLFNV